MLKMVLHVLSLNNFIVTKTIKTEQNVKHIIRKPEWFGGMLVYRLTNTWYLVLHVRPSILHTCGTIARVREEVWGVTAYRPSPNRGFGLESDVRAEDSGSGLGLERVVCTYQGKNSGT